MPHARAMVAQLAAQSSGSWLHNWHSAHAARWRLGAHMHDHLGARMATGAMAMAWAAKRGAAHGPGAACARRMRHGCHVLSSADNFGMRSRARAGSCATPHDPAL